MSPRRLALIGANGMLARKVAALAPAHYELHGFDLPEFDLTDAGQVSATLDRLRPDVIVNCAAYTNVDGAESEPELAQRINGDGPGYLARAARDLDATLVHVSTDYVFPGTSTRPYREDDATAPRSAYGRTKLAGELAIAASGLQRCFIVRTSWLFGPGGRNFVETVLRLAAERDELRIVADQVGSPTYTGDLAEAIFRLLALDDPARYGLYHFANAGEVSWHGFACAIVAQARQQGMPLRAQQVVAIRTDDYPLPAPRPAYSVLATDKYRSATGAAIPDWPSGLSRYLHERLP